jgi:hypothetical protein
VGHDNILRSSSIHYITTCTAVLQYYHIIYFYISRYYVRIDDETRTSKTNGQGKTN